MPGSGVPPRPKAASPQDLQDKLLLQGGLFVFALLALVPVLNCIQLLSDHNLSFWIGAGFAWGWLMLCILLVVLYFFTVTLYIRMAPEQTRQQTQPGFMIFRTFVGLLGLMLIAQSFPIASVTSDTAEKLTYSCESHGRGSSLHSYYHRLKAIRTDATCADKFSVETCSGWQDTEYNNYIFWMENNFHCANICPESVPRLSPVEPPAATPAQPTNFQAPSPMPEMQAVASMPAVDDASAGQVQDAANAGPVAPAANAQAGTALVHHSKERKHRTTNLRHVDHVTPLGSFMEKLQLTEKFARTRLDSIISESLSLVEEGAELATTRTRALIGTDQDPVAAAAASAGLLGADPYSARPDAEKHPNALFSRAHYEHRCGLMIALDLRNHGKAMSDATFANGIALFIVSIFSSALELAVRVSQRDGEKRAT